MTTYIAQRTGEPKLTDASYATVRVAWDAANAAGNGFAYDRTDDDELLHCADRDDELDVFRTESGTIIAVSNDGWACSI